MCIHFLAPSVDNRLEYKCHYSYSLSRGESVHTESQDASHSLLLDVNASTSQYQFL